MEDLKTVEKQFNCDFCYKKLASGYLLKKHRLIHTGEKPYECSMCPKRFADKSSVTKHVRTHTGEKPYVCPICQKRFSQTNHLNIHFRSHTGEKPYVCIFCQKAYSTSTRLKSHHRRHTKEKPYVCDICQREFYEKKQMKLHNLTHSREKPYSCDKCCKRYRVKRSWTLHKCRKPVHNGPKLTAPNTAPVCGKNKPLPSARILPYRKICPAPKVISPAPITLLELKELHKNVTDVTTLQQNLPNVITIPASTTSVKVKELHKNSLPFRQISNVATPQQKTSPMRNILPARQSLSPSVTAPIFLLVTYPLIQPQETSS